MLSAEILTAGYGLRKILLIFPSFEVYTACCLSNFQTICLIMKITAVNVAEEESFEYSGLIRQRREYTRGLTSILGLRVGFRLIGVLCFFLALDYVASDNVLLLGMTDRIIDLKP